MSDKNRLEQGGGRAGGGAKMSDQYDEGE